MPSFSALGPGSRHRSWCSTYRHQRSPRTARARAKEVNVYWIWTMRWRRHALIHEIRIARVAFDRSISHVNDSQSVGCLWLREGEKAFGWHPHVKADQTIRNTCERTARLNLKPPTTMRSTCEAGIISDPQAMMLYVYPIPKAGAYLRSLSILCPGSDPGQVL